MAKNKGGLGRGLNSLLGASNDSIPQETQKVDRITKLPGEGVLPEMPNNEVKTPPAPPSPASIPTAVDSIIDDQNNINNKIEDVNQAINEDNVTIKEVIARPVAQPASQPAPQPVQVQVETVGLKDTAEVPLDKVFPNPDQPRTNFKKDELEELAESIKKNGLLQPILVRSMPDGTYQIIAGERRWQACRLLKMENVPVRIHDADDDETIILALIENIQRSDLNPIEEAYGYRRMMERGKMTQAEVAQAVSKGRSTIANALRLLELPEDAQQLLFEEKITAGHARAILSVPAQDGRRKLTDKLVESNLTVRETESMARLLAGKKDKKETPRQQAPKSYKTIARALGDTLGTEVKIKSVKGKNKIEIDFKDETDLERLFRKITSNN